MLRGDRAPQQDRDQQREDDDVLERAALKRREALQNADADRAERRQRIAGHAAHDGADEGLEAEQEAGIVEDRIDRRDQDAGDAGHQRPEQVGDRAGARRPDAHQPRAGPVDGGRAQRLAGQRELEEEEQQAAEQQCGDDDQQRLPGHMHAGDFD